MLTNANKALSPDKMSAAFEHSITWEEDIWRSDPVDAQEVHPKARAKFGALLEAITDNSPNTPQARILLFHGQSGAGKTHLIRALRTSAHRDGKAYFGYAQMSPDITNYADYFLQRLINSLEKPYDPDGVAGAGNMTALAQLTDHIMTDAEVISPDALQELRDADLPPMDLARLVMRLADDIVACDKFAAQDLDINIVRALLYLQRKDPRIDQRVRQYLQGRQLNELSQEAVAALDPNEGEGRSFEIIESLGKLMWTVDRSAMVFCIDQVEDLRFFDDANERFQKAVRDLIQIANRIPTSIILISCLTDFYSQAREVLAQSYIDRIEKSGPVALTETRTCDEARAIIAKRIAYQTMGNEGLSETEAEALFSPQFYEEFRGLPARRLLEHAQSRCQQDLNGGDDEAGANGGDDDGFISSLAAALGGGFSFGGDDDNNTKAASGDPEFDYRDQWERFNYDSEAEAPSDDQELMHALNGALVLAVKEWDGAVDLTVSDADVSSDLPCFDIAVRHNTGHHYEARIFLCNRPTQGGGLKRQLDKVLPAMGGKNCVMLRASDFPPNRKNQTAERFRKFRDAGGRSIMVPIPEWERMMTVREFHTRHRMDPGFEAWFGKARMLSNLVTIVQLLRLDLLGGRPLDEAAPRANKSAPVAQAEGAAVTPIAGALTNTGSSDGDGGSSEAPAIDAPGVHVNGVGDPALSDDESNDANDNDNEPAEEPLPLSVLLADDDGSSIFAGREISREAAPIRLNTDVLKRHAAVLGGSGSGKTTLALSIIEQLLLRGIPAVLIDRKGDLCSYANPDVWRAQEGEFTERRGDREKLGDAIDVAVYTPGRSSGRPISITLLPNGINELPGHEQQLLANLSAAAIGEMLHLKNSATHQKQSGTLSVALRILGSRSTSEVTLADLIYMLEDEDPELTDLTQRMDPSGKIRRDLVAQLDSLRHRNSALFEEGGEPLSMEALLGIGPYARIGRTRLSVIYTGFLGDNENILFWVSQFLAEALRFCQRNPNDELQAVVMFDEADLYIPANAKPATAEPLQSLLKRARSAGLGIMLATQSPGDLDYKSRDQITSWFIGRVREDTALRKLKAAFQSESGLDPVAVLPLQTVGEFHLVQEAHVRAMKAQQSLIEAEQVPFDRIEQLASETKGQDERQLGLFDK